MHNLGSKFAISVTDNGVIKDLRVFLHAQELNYSASVAAIIISPIIVLQINKCKISLQ